MEQNSRVVKGLGDLKGQAGKLEIQISPGYNVVNIYIACRLTRKVVLKECFFKFRKITEDRYCK